MPRSSSDVRRDRYLDVALDLFIANGYDGTSTDMIVAEAGGSKATLYQQFPAKDAIVDGLVDRIRAAATGTQLSTALLDAPLEEGLREIGRLVAEGAWSDEVVVLLRLAMGEFHRFPHLAQTLWDVGPAVSYRNFISYLEHKKQVGEVIECDTQLAAEHYLAGLVAHRQLKAAMDRAPLPTGDERDRMIDAAVETFVARYAVERTV